VDGVNSKKTITGKDPYGNKILRWLKEEEAKYCIEPKDKTFTL